MAEVAKEDVPAIVAALLQRGGLNLSEIPRLPVGLLQSGAFDVGADSGIRSADVRKTVVLGGEGGVRTARVHMNVFACAGGAMAAAIAPNATVSAITAFIGLLRACTVSLNGAQAAFFLASRRLDIREELPTANNLAAVMSTHLDRPVTPEEVVAVATSLRDMGVPVTIEEPPDYIVRHTEWVITLPSF